MKTTNELHPLKHKVLWAYHQDGILDITTATVLLGFSAFMATTNVVFLIAGVLFVSQYLFLKQRVTMPRFGYVRFESQEKMLKRNLIFLVIGVIVILSFFIGKIVLRNLPVSIEIREFTQRYHMVPLSAMLFAFPMIVAAALLGLKRFYLYALLAIALPAIGAYLNIETYVPILSTGVVIVVTGIVLLSIFMKKYPKHNEEGKDGNE
jgi:hypothetical protein